MDTEQTLSRVEYMQRKRDTKQRKSLFGRRRVQVMLTLGVLMLATAVIIGSAASFTSTSVNIGNLVTAGNLTHDNSKANSFFLDAKKMWPGETRDGSVTLTNTGDASARFYLTITGIRDAQPGPGTASLSTALELRVVNETTGVDVYSGLLTDFPKDGIDSAQDAGVLAPGAPTTYRFSVTFPDSDEGLTTKGSDNKYKNSRTEVDFSWEAISE